MVKVEDIETMGWHKAIKGMRNPLNSWNKMDSQYCNEYTDCGECPIYNLDNYVSCSEKICNNNNDFVLGPNDLDLAIRLIKAGSEHRKFLRMIHVQMDIAGPLYWWKEMDTYKIATTANSCSTMHKIVAKEFTLEDFSHEYLTKHSMRTLLSTIEELNFWRDIFQNGGMVDNEDGTARVFEPKDKEAWWQLIQLLPSSYNQLRTWDGNMETILSILHQRAHHKLDTDWEPFRQACFDNIPYCKEFYEAMYDKEEN